MPADDRWQAAEVVRLAGRDVTDLDARFRPAQHIAGQPRDVERVPDFHDEEVVLIELQAELERGVELQPDDLERAVDFAQFSGEAADQRRRVDLLDVRSGSDDETAWLGQPDIRVLITAHLIGKRLNRVDEFTFVVGQALRVTVEWYNPLRIARKQRAAHPLLDEHEHGLLSLQRQSIFEKNVGGASAWSIGPACDHGHEAGAQHHHGFEVGNREELRLGIDSEEKAFVVEELPEEGIDLPIGLPIAVAEIRQDFADGVGRRIRFHDGHRFQAPRLVCVPVNGTS